MTYIIKPRTARLRYYKSVYGISAKDIDRLGGLARIDSMSEDALLVLINQQKNMKLNVQSESKLDPHRYYRSYTRRNNGKAKEDQL